MQEETFYLDFQHPCSLCVWSCWGGGYLGWAGAGRCGWVVEVALNDMLIMRVDYEHNMYI